MFYKSVLLTKLIFVEIDHQRLGKIDQENETKY